ncbi:uridine kinase [Paractinoplanes hotanensis]|uniref:Uridine kinase n=1 Tax=Paractinoplanes hotanensis TaxID=2906497 RepID=A0ABT0XX24_9ACTN|nr:uridine kinase [Actinoplanes hotanensis]MCM4077659.1 uridine kinase [Actinoplanes hotanensis]
MRVRPISTDVLVEELADLLTSRESDSYLRVAFDGAPATGPGALGDALVGPLRARGRPAMRIDAADFLRPASLRLEFGRNDPDSYYQGWFDEAGLAREVLDPAGPGGSGRVLARLWDATADRAVRESYAELPAGAILLVSGPLLLGGGLAFDVTVHLEMSAAALLRRTPAEDAWTLPAFGRYAEEVGPASLADVVLRVDDPRRPAMVLERS